MTVLKYRSLCQVLLLGGVALGCLLVAGCQLPLSEQAGLRSLTVQWSTGSNGVRILTPAYLEPSTYEVVLHPAVGSDISQTGLTSNSWTFHDLAAKAYTITVTGLDGGGKALVEGIGSADLTETSPATPTIVLNYLTSGSGRGQIHLTFTLTDPPEPVTSAIFSLVDPSGAVVTDAALSGSFPTYTYTDTNASAGTYKFLAQFNGTTQTAYQSETILVCANLDTVAEIPVYDTDFTPTFVPVTGISVSPDALNLSQGARGNLTASLVPTTASNPLVVWTSSDPAVAMVDQTGTVTPVGLGTATITAASTENPIAIHATCDLTITGSVTYDPNGADSGSAVTDLTNYHHNAAVVVAANTEGLSLTDYVFCGWNTQSDGLGTDYEPGSTFNITANTTLYAQWTPKYLCASDSVYGDYLGSSVILSVDGMTAFIGSAGNSQGAVYVFKKTGSSWVQVQKLVASDGVPADYFGYCLALTEDEQTLLVSAPRVDSSQGAVYAFTKNGNTWSQIQKITASDGMVGDYFGISLAAASVGSTFFVGEYWQQNDNRGAVYAFARSGSNWTQTQKITASDGASYENFGASISTAGDGNALFVLSNSVQVASQGAVYVFAHSGENWSEIQKIVPSEGSVGFGPTLVLSADGATLVLGALGTSGTLGSVYSFAKSEGLWTPIQTIADPEAVYLDRFSIALSNDGNTMISAGQTASEGLINVFSKSGSLWTWVQKVPVSSYFAGFGYSMALSVAGSSLLVGEPGFQGVRYGNNCFGEVNLFTRSGNLWY